MKQDIAVRIVLVEPNSGVDFGVQKGSGNNYETIQVQQFTGADLRFEFSISAQLNGNEAVDFSGPIVQGPKGGRFIYVDIGSYAGQKHHIWGRRLKVPLSGIDPQTIEKLLKSPGLILQTKVAGKGKDGTPNCATVKPFEGWRLVVK